MSQRENGTLRVGALAPIADWRWLQASIGRSDSDEGGDQAPIGPIYGRPVVIATFINAVIAHGTARYDIIIPYAAPKVIAELTSRCAGCCPDRVTVRGVLDLPDLLASGTLDVLHDQSGPDLYRLTHVRNRFARKPVPCSGVIHNVSDPVRIYHDLSTVLSGCLPSDTIIGTSAACTRAERLRMIQIQGRLSEVRFARCFNTPQVVTLPLGVDTDRFSPLDRRTARDRLALPIDSCIVLYFGRFSASDKADLLPLLRAFATARGQFPGDMRLVLAGDDRPSGYGQGLMDLAARWGLDAGVQLVPGPIAPHGSTKRAIFSAADIFVSPVDNVQETFGLTPVEAMAFGLPIIASDWDGYRDIVRPGRDGVLIPTRWAGISNHLDTLAPLLAGAEDHFYIAQGVSVDVEALAEAILALARDADLRARLGASARRRAAETFDWRVVIRRYEDLWREMVDAARSDEDAYASPTALLDLSREQLVHDYPSQPLDPDLLVETTVSGRRVLEGSSDLGPLYAEIAPFINLRSVKHILSRAQTPHAIRRLHVRVSQHRRECLLPDGFLVMWLLKNGYLAMHRGE